MIGVASFVVGTRVDFGEVPLTTSRTAISTWTNPGPGAETIDRVELVGSGGFTVTDDGCAGQRLRAGESCAVTITFAPTALGLVGAELWAQLADGRFFEASVWGTGIPAPPRPPVLRAQPDPTDLGRHLVGEEAPTKTVTAANVGGGTITVGQVEIVGIAADDYSIVTNDCVVVLTDGGTSCSVEVGFTPSEPGGRAASLVFRGVDSTDRRGADDRVLGVVRLDGRGRVPGPRFRATPDPIDFGTALLGTAPTRTVTIHNDGTDPLVISSLSVVGTDAADFTLDSTTCIDAPVEPDETCEAVIGHRPGRVGDHRAALRSVDNAPGSPRQVVVRSTVPKPEIVIDPGVGPPGLVAEVIGRSWPPGETVTLTWVGVDQLYSATVGDDGTFSFPGMLVLPRSQLGTRQAGATAVLDGGEVVSAIAPFLVVAPTVDGTPQFVFRR